jgi:TPR repeat protein
MELNADITNACATGFKACSEIYRRTEHELTACERASQHCDTPRRRFEFASDELLRALERKDQENAVAEAEAISHNQESARQIAHQVEERARQAEEERDRERLRRQNEAYAQTQARQQDQERLRREKYVHLREPGKPVSQREWAMRCQDGDGFACLFQGWQNGCSRGVSQNCQDCGLAYYWGESSGKDIPMVSTEAMRYFKLACTADPSGENCWGSGNLLAKGQTFCPTDSEIEWFYAQACQKNPAENCAKVGLVYERAYDSLPCIERTQLRQRAKRYYGKGCGAGNGAACEQLRYFKDVR